MERILTIELFGEQHKFQAEADDSNAEAIIHYLEQKVNDAGMKMTSPGRDVNKFAQLLLAALNISYDFFEVSKKHENVLKAIDERSSKIVGEIDKNLID